MERLRGAAITSNFAGGGRAEAGGPLRAHVRPDAYVNVAPSVFS